MQIVLFGQHFVVEISVNKGLFVSPQVTDCDVFLATHPARKNKQKCSGGKVCTDA